MSQLATAQVVDWPGHRELLREIRRRVFVEEQGVSQEEEWDGRDAEATHFLAQLEDGRPVGCGRLLPDGQIGRMAVLRPVRNQGIGAVILDAVVAEASRQGFPEVFLHAQLQARSFYHRAGFAAEGEEFMEADIAHIRMARRLDVAFDPPPPPLPQPAIVPEPARADAPEEAENRRLLTTTWIEAQEAAATLTSRARRRLRIYSPLLCPQVWASPQVVDAVSALVRGYANAQVQVLVHDPRTIIARPHGLVDLSKRISSKVHMRRVHNDQMENSEQYVLSDVRGVAIQADHREPGGWVNYNEPVWGKRLDDTFEEQWNRAYDDPNLRDL